MTHQTQRHGFDNTGDLLYQKQKVLKSQDIRVDMKEVNFLNKKLVQTATAGVQANDKLFIQAI